MAGIPQVISSDSASGAQIIDGSLTFERTSDSVNTYLYRNFTNGNSKKWTWSTWIKRGNISSTNRFFGGNNGSTDDNNWFTVLFHPTDGDIRFGAYGSFPRVSNGAFRDTSGWYHLVVNVDIDNATSSKKYRAYINGQEVTWSSSSDKSNTGLNRSGFVGYIGAEVSGVGGSANNGFGGSMTQCYFLDGLALGPGYFGFTDPLTNAWKPKKFKAEGTTVNDGTVWSAGAGANFESANPATNGFNGNPSSYTRTDNANVTATVTFSKPIHFSTLEVTGARDSGNGLIKVNGVDVSSQFASGSATLQTIDLTQVSGVSSPLTSISLTGIGGAAQPRFSEIIVDGVTMLDSTTTNLAFGTNGYYLPMDGNSVIGQDKSGQGNDWTPVNFGGSVSLDKTSSSKPAAQPILNTTPGGTQARVGVRDDDYFANHCVLALPLVGNANDVSNQINSGSTTKAITVTNAVASNDKSNFYSGSFYFDGSGDYLNTNSSSDFGFGTGAFTVEAWIYPTALTSPAHYLFAFSSNDSVIGWDQSTGDLNIQLRAAGAPALTKYKSVIVNKWQHFAVTRDGVGNVRAYLDGVLAATTTDSGDMGSSGTCTIGNRIGLSREVIGYVQDVRVYKGNVKYQGLPFSPAATFPDFIPDSPSGVSASSKLTKITDGAVSFDGDSTCFITVPSSTDFGLVAQDWTVECYAYIEEMVGSYGRLWYLEGSSSADIDGVYFSNTHMSMGSTNLWSIGDGTGGEYRRNKWMHVAVCHDSTNIRLYIDGIEALTSTNDFYNSSSKKLTLMSTNNGSYAGGGRGFISNFRIVNGTALYTSNFTPPTEPLTNITNTKLLCCQSNTSAGEANVVPGASGINDGTSWSDFVTVTEGNTGANYNVDASNMFDGDTSTATSLYSGNMVSPYSNTTVVFTPPTPLTVSSSLRVYMAVDRGQRIYVNYSQTNASVSSGWNNTGFTGTLTSILIGPSNLGSSNNISAIEIDGVILKNLVLPKGPPVATTFNPFNTDIDTVRGQETGYATLNPLDNTGITKLANGNLDFRRSVNDGRINSTISASSGKWYAECQVGNDTLIGISEVSSLTTTYPGGNTGSYGYFQGGNFYDAGSAVAYADSFTTGDCIGCILDLDNGTIAYTKNGVSQGVAKTGLPSGSYRFSSRGGRHDGTETLDRWNFGQKPFKFSPPDGYQPLNIDNLLSSNDEVITRPDQFVGVVTWSGEGNTNDRTIPTKFKPDFIWSKARNNTYHHNTFDSVRGFGSNNTLAVDYQSAEGAVNGGRIKSVSDTGITWESGGGSYAAAWYNESYNYVSWFWKAGGSSGTFNKDDIGYANASDIDMNAGALNTLAYNQTQTWSSLLTATGSSFDQAASNAFNGTIDDGTRLRTGGNYILVDMRLSTPITVTSMVEVYAETNYDSTCTITVDDNTFISESGAVHTFTNISGSLTRMTLRNNGSSGRTYMEGMKVDGKLLVDNGVSVGNVPSITPTGCSVGTKQGFSIVSYIGNESSGSSFAHGLSQPPEFVIIKNRTNSEYWMVWHKSIGETENNNAAVIFLNANQGQSHGGSYANYYPIVKPDSNVVHVGASSNTNENASPGCIAYCWHSVPGLQKFGSYVGNGSADGPFIETGFRPAILLTKRIDGGTNNWQLIDSTRDLTNDNTNTVLKPDESSVETSHADYATDFLSNGFKHRTGHIARNGATNKYIYMAWAEAPTVNLYGGQSNAR